MPAGRPTVFTEVVLQKLEYAFSLGCTDREACFYAGISQASLYDYQNANPEYVERKEALKEMLIFKARETLSKTIEDPKNSQWYLERKNKKEFAQRSELSDPNGEGFVFKIFNYKDEGDKDPKELRPTELSTGVSEKQS